MKKLAFLLCCATVAGCAGPGVERKTGRGGLYAAARSQQLQTMRRAARTAADHLELTACPMQPGSSTIVRSLTTSSQCIGCHDGAGSAPSIGSHSHPTHVAYAVSPGRASALRDEVADGIILVNGNVECTSCHDPASRFPSSTALTLDRSTLCLGCHRR